MKKAWAVVIVGFMVVALSVPPARAQHRGIAGEMGPGMFYMLFRGANLSAEQTAKVKEILQAHRGRTRDLMKQLRAARTELTDMLFAPGAVTAEDLQPLRQRTTQLWEQLSQERLAAALDIRAVLTPAQLAKAEKLKDRFRQLRKEMQELSEEK
jgi:Spy/CpxP family protein refolding chaperone